MKMNHKQEFHCALFTLLCLFVTLNSNAADVGSLRGQVTDMNGKPVEGVELCIFESDLKITNSKINNFSSHALQCTKSDKSGSYFFSSVNKPAITVIGHKRDLWFLRLATDENDPRADTLRPCGSLRFHVRVEKSQRHDNVSVSLIGTPFSVKSDRSGAVSISCISSGAYTAVLNAGQPGYLDVQCSLRIVPSKIDTFPDTLVLPFTGLSTPTITKSSHDTATETTPQKKNGEPVADSVQIITPAQNITNEQSIAGKNKVVIPDSVKKIFKKPETPVVNAGRDTIAGLRDEVTLSGNASVKDGTIAKWEWAIGSAPFQSVPDGMITVNAPAIVTTPLTCVLRVTTNDGVQAMDTVDIRGRSSPPVARISGDSTAGLFDSINLRGTAKDNGSILSMSWDIGNKGTFTITRDGAITVPPVRTPMDSLVCIFRAIDDDGETSFDTTKIPILVRWKTVTPQPSIPERKGHALVDFNGMLWIIGGNKSDIWNSADGVEWQKITDSAPFGERFGHSATAFSGQILVIGGKSTGDHYTNDIWSSPDGKNWSRVLEADFLRRHYHSVTQFKGRLWMIGGLGESGYESSLNDIWSSEDGARWKPEKDTSLFSRRYGHGSVVFNNELLISGGFYEGFGGTRTLSDTWKSSDGITWKPEIDTISTQESVFHSFLSYDNRIWAIGGYCNTCTDENRFSNIGYSTDGAGWIPLIRKAESGSKHFNAAVVFNDRIIISPSDTPYLFMLQ